MGITGPQHFFAVLCPQVLATRADAARAFGGSCGFVISGPSGGAWRIDLTRASIEAGAAAADVVVKMSDTDLTALLKGALDIPRARREGRLVIDGDQSRLSFLSVIFRP